MELIRIKPINCWQVIRKYANDEVLIDKIISIMYNKPSEYCTQKEVGTFDDVVYFNFDKILNSFGEVLIDLSDGFINGRPQKDYVSEELAKELFKSVQELIDAEKLIYIQ